MCKSRDPFFNFFYTGVFVRARCLRGARCARYKYDENMILQKADDKTYGNKCFLLTCNHIISYLELERSSTPLQIMKKNRLARFLFTKILFSNLENESTKNIFN